MRKVLQNRLGQERNEMLYLNIGDTFFFIKEKMARKNKLKSLAQTRD
jgi:hypothetical protein